MFKSLKVAFLLAFTSITKGNKGVLALTIFILALVATNLFFVRGLLDGLVSGANGKLIYTYTGDIVVESNEKSQLRYADELAARIEAIYGVKAVAVRNSLSAAVVFEEQRTNCIVYGIEPDKEKAVFQIQTTLIEGSYLDPRDEDKILLGIQVAGADQPDIELYSRSLRRVHAGDKVDVTFANGVKKRYVVKGIFHTQFIQTDLQAFVPEREFYSINPSAKDRATSIHVRISPEADARDIMEQIGNIRSGLRILRWEDYAGIVRSMTDSFNTINVILNMVNLLVAGVVVFIVTYIDVVNKRRQIGVQRAIGITSSSITIAYLLRAVFYAVVAAVVATLAFTYVAIPLEARYPFHFPFGDVYLVTSRAYQLRTATVMLAVSVFSAFIPVRTVMRMKILDAIWG